MTDIVEQLRMCGDGISNEAAQEIERLRALVDDLVAAHGDATTAARAAAKKSKGYCDE